MPEWRPFRRALAAALPILKEADGVVVLTVPEGERPATDGPVRQFVLGGATSHILEYARLPVLMAH